MSVVNEMEFETLRRVRPGENGKRHAGVWDVVCWAFQREKVSIEFDALQQGGEERPGVGMEYILMEQARLGCRVQGGGTSPKHHDAEIVASFLAVLPEGCGGRRMACDIAELARAGQVPQHSAPTKVLPVSVLENQHGKRAKAEDAATLGSSGWPHMPRRNRRGVTVYEPVKFCPVSIRPTGQEIAAMRRRYLLWWSALLDLRNSLKCSHLTGFSVTDAMPPKTPWLQEA